MRRLWLRLRKLLQVRAAGCRNPVAQPEPESGGGRALHLPAVHRHDARRRPVVLDPHLVHRERLPRSVMSHLANFRYLPMQPVLKCFLPSNLPLQVSMGSRGHGTSPSLRPTGAVQLQPLARTTTCWNIPLCRAVKYSGINGAILKLRPWVNCRGLQRNVSTWFDTTGDNEARRFAT